MTHDPERCEYDMPYSDAGHNPLWCGGDMDGQCAVDDPCWPCIRWLHDAAIEAAWAELG
jgi:hypothetical protein